MKVIVGLGNPGTKYEGTRHNVGSLVADAVLAGLGGSFGRRRKWFRSGDVAVCGTNVVVAKPTVFMNESGRAIEAIVKSFEVMPNDCLVVVDDVNLPLGKIRFRPRGSSGSHKGLESIIGALGTSDFPRLRVGVGKPQVQGGDLADYVLGQFAGEEREVLASVMKRAKSACLAWVGTDPETVMQRFN